MSVAPRPRTAAPAQLRVRADSASRRMVDFIIAALALLILAPVMIAMVLLIHWTSPGPALYRQERIGRDGRPFQILKFRTMMLGADQSGALVTGKRDPRVTKLGALLRAAKIDELPQLLNVLCGHMTLIGPRPEVARYVTAYSSSERDVLLVRPGLTGPGQLHFSAKQAVDLDGLADPEQHYLRVHLHRKLAIDLDYLLHRTLRRDLLVLLQTLVALLLRLLMGAAPRWRPPISPGRSDSPAGRRGGQTTALISGEGGDLGEPGGGGAGPSRGETADRGGYLIGPCERA